jgi:ParB-like chromosome segregation protein Spo0J
MKIKQTKLKDLKPYENNPRLHSELQIIQIAESIKEFGFINPILSDEKGMILAGHGRFLASQRLDLDKVPVVVIDGLDDEQKKALVIADNKIASNSEWDEGLLWDQIRELNDKGFDITKLAFEEVEILPMLDPNVVQDLSGEWEDMPEFSEEDKSAYRTLLVHFMNDEDIEKFKKLVKQEFTEKTKFIYFPEQPNMDTEAKRYD